MESFHGMKMLAWYLIQVVMLLLVLTPPSELFSSLNEFKAEISPVDKLVATGDTLEVSCTLTHVVRNFTARNILFHFNQLQTPTVANDTTAILRIHNVTRKMTQSNVSCYMKDSAHSLQSVAQTTFRVADKPERPVVTGCVVYNWQSMECKWKPEKQETGIATNQTLYWSIICSPKDYYYCPDAKQNLCYWPPYNEKSELNSFRSGQYCMFVRASNQLGQLDSRIYTVTQTSNIVKPDVVRDLRQTILSSRSVTLTWSPPNSDEKHVRYYVNYELNRNSLDQNCHRFETAEPVVNQTKITTNLSITLDDLIPYSCYRIRISSIPLVLVPVAIETYEERGFRSDDKILDLDTKSDVPGQMLSVARGQLDIELFWQPLPRRLEHGKMEYVRIRYREFNDDDWKEISFKYFDPKKSGFLKSLSADSYYFVHIDANNTEGFNESFVQTPIVIPSVDHAPQQPAHFIVEGHQAQNNIHTVTANWTRVSDASGYTIFWCEMGTSGHCKSGEVMNWVVLLENDTITSVELNEKSFKEYRFGISVEAWSPAVNSTISSGILWTDCIHNVRNIVKSPIDLKLSPHQSAYSISVEWKSPTCEDSAYILHFLLKVCQMTNCDHEHEKSCCSEHRIARNETSITIADLMAGEDYNVQLSSVSYLNQSSFTEPVQHSVYGSGLSKGATAGVVIGSIFLLVFLILGVISIAQKCRKSFLKLTSDVPIVVPNARRIDPDLDVYSSAYQTNENERITLLTGGDQPVIFTANGVGGGKHADDSSSFNSGNHLLDHSPDAKPNASGDFFPTQVDSTISTYTSVAPTNGFKKQPPEDNGVLKVESNCGESELDEVQSTTIPVLGFAKVSPRRAAMPYTTVDKIAEVGSDGGNVLSLGITPYSTVEQVHVSDSSNPERFLEPGDGWKSNDKHGSDKMDVAPTAVGKPTATVAPLQQEQNLTTSSDTTDPHRRNHVVDSSRASTEMPNNCVNAAAADEHVDGLKADSQTENHSRDGTGSKSLLPSGYVSWAPKV